MKTILFPTDFSANADSAINHAVSIARIFNAELILFNSYPIPVYVTDMPVDMQMNNAMKTESENKLTYLSNKLITAYPDLKVRCASNWGFASDEIVTAAADFKSDLIIMSTRGAGIIKKLFLGSNTAAVISKAHCPVLAIPAGTEYKPILNIVFASDCMDDEFEAIEKMNEWIEKFNASLTLLHIDDGILNHQFESTIVHAFKEKITARFKIKKIEFEHIDVPDFVSGLNEFLIDGSFDLLVMAHHSRNFINQLLNPSHTRSVAYNLVTPLLMIPIAKNQ